MRAMVGAFVVWAAMTPLAAGQTIEGAVPVSARFIPPLSVEITNRTDLELHLPGQSGAAHYDVEPDDSTLSPAEREARSSPTYGERCGTGLGPIAVGPHATIVVPLFPPTDATTVVGRYRGVLHLTGPGQSYDASFAFGIVHPVDARYEHERRVVP